MKSSTRVLSKDPVGRGKKKEIYTAKDFIQSLFWIENKEREVVPFLFNEVQGTYWKDMTRRDVILKARQEGFSSLILAIWLSDCLQIENTASVVISHEREATQRLLRRVKDYIRYLKSKTGLKVELEYSSRDLLSFPKTNSTFYIGTAGSKAFGRGDTINNLHCSEIAWWEDPKNIMAGLTQAVPRNGRIVIETTAHGYGDYFHRLWQKATEGVSAFKPHFFGWNMHKEYQVKAPSGRPELTVNEQKLRERYNLTYKQIFWRREKVGEFDTLEDFQREYPINDMEAFIASGVGVFNENVLKEMFGKAPPPVQRGNIHQ